MEKTFFPDIEAMKRHSIKVLSEMIRAYCDREEMTYEQFAAKAGISLRTVISIASYDPGKKGASRPNPTNDTIIAIGQTCEKALWWADEWRE